MQQIAKISGVADRLRQLIDYFRVKSAAGLARLADISRQTIETAIRRDAISPETAASLGEALNIRPEWIIFGSGPMIAEAKEDTESTCAGGAYSIVTAAVRKVGFEVESSAEVSRNDYERLKSMIRDIPSPPSLRDSFLGKTKLSKEDLEQLGPMLARIVLNMKRDMDNFFFVRRTLAKLGAGGGLIPDEEFAEEQYVFRRDWLKRIATSLDKVILMEVEGDSMAPTLQSKNIVLVDRGRAEFRGGKIFAIGIGDVIQVKRLDIIHGGNVRIISDNPIYPIFEIPADELRIIGQVIWGARTFI